MKALVSMTISPTSIFVVRRLQQLGFNITAVDSKHRSYGSYSKTVQKTIIAPSLRYDPLGFAHAILQELKNEKYDLYFPVFECSFLMAYFQDTVRQYTNMVAMPYDTILNVHNKGLLQEYGKKAGVRVIASTQAPRSLEEAEAICASLDYPVVIKGQVSRNAHGQKIVLEPTKAFEEYLKIAQEGKGEDDLPLIQRYIKGSLISSVNYAVNGKMFSSVVFRALRTVPTEGGTSCYRETVDVPEADHFNKKLIESFGWTGFISFDFMQDEITGELFLIDINPRIAPGVALGYYAGVDMLKTYVDHVLGGALPLPERQDIGVRSKLHFLDLGWMLFNLMDKKLSAGQKWQAFRQWTKREKSRGDIFVWNDLYPTVKLYGFILRQIGGLVGPHGGEIFLEHSLFDNHLLAKQLMESTKPEVAVANE